MDEEKIDYYIWTVDQIFRDFLGRRAGLIKALTADFKKFHKKCDPEKPNMCLYGRPNETWKVEERPLRFGGLPKPHSGINRVRDGMLEKDWLAHVAIHSDAWINSVAFYIAARAGFDDDARQQLFNMINSNPTIYEIVSGTVKMPAKEEETSGASGKDNRSRSKKRSSLAPVLGWPLPSIEEEEDVEDEAEQMAAAADHSSITCGACGRWMSDDTEYWIFCDVCGTWYHGNCVRVTPERYEQLERYKCPRCCRHKRART